MNRGSKILGIGVIIFSVTMLIEHLVGIPEIIMIFAEVMGVALEMLGVFLLFIDKRNK